MKQNRRQIRLKNYDYSENGAYKSAVTRRINLQGGHGTPCPYEKSVKSLIWQSRFHDHIIRTQKDYDEIWEYIDTNPIKWELDKYFME